MGLKALNPIVVTLVSLILIYLILSFLVYVYVLCCLIVKLIG